MGKSGGYRVGPPDELMISVLPDPAIERKSTVRPDGMISIDLVGDVPAAGRTSEEIAQDIQERIGRFKRDASVTVSVMNSLSSEITVVGEVGRPSTFPLQRETRLIEAIGMVGGARQFADKEGIRIIRFEDGQTTVMTVSLAGIEHGDLSTNYLLRGGDVIVVPPTKIAAAGYWVQSVFFPVQAILGIGVGVMTGGVVGGGGGVMNQ
jgi:polysaccharide export outer membrane protein